MNAIKKLFVVKGNDKEKLNDTLPNFETTENKQTYYDSGYEAAKTANGASTILKSCLDDIYEKFKEKCREDDKEQQRLNAPFIYEKERQKSILNARETLKSIKEETLEDIKSDIQQIDNDIVSVQSEPEKFGINATKKPKAQFFIGLIILLPITLYLLVFYISASYSAFFKIFDSNDLIAAIFDANALNKAIADGWLEAVFVCTIPFAFMGLGYLIHMFQKEGNNGKLKVTALFLITFVFDSILAYQIEKKIYDFDKTLTSPQFDLQTAVSSVEFWGIIFAGFVVYIIWGLVFDFIMKEHDNIDKIKVFINKLKGDKSNLLAQKGEVSQSILELKEEITEIKGKISELQSKIDGFIFPNRKYLYYHSEYVKGWYMGISHELALTHEKQDFILKDCENIVIEHLNKHNISDENNENIIYNKNLIN
jgi:hypothetical protein